MARWDEDLLRDLNVIADYVIGNEIPQDASFTSRNTLPESLAYITIYPTNQTAVKEALAKMKKLSDMVNALDKKVKQLHYKNELKIKKC